MRRALAAVTAAVCVAGLFTAGCAPSTSEIQRARGSQYRAPFAAVWNAVVDEMSRDFRDFRVEDALKGRIDTDWIRVEKSGGDETMREGEIVLGGIFFRMRARIRGDKGGPWRVSIDGEAAAYRPDLAMLQPYGRGAADEPTWVQARIDRVVVNVHRKLERYAEQVPEGHVRRRSFDTTKWANLPAGAAHAVGAVREAARKRNTAEMLPFLAPRVTYAEGVEGEATRAAAIWGADPATLATLVTLLDGGCGVDAGATRVTCPPADRQVAGGAPPAGRVELAPSASGDGNWQLVTFVRSP